MSLPKFNIIVAIDANGGIAKDGEIPWHSPGDLKYFAETTTGRGKNYVIMGRVTYETIPKQHFPFKNRKNIIISKTQSPIQGVLIFPSFLDALKYLGMNSGYDEIYVIGGEQLYAEALSDYMYLCHMIHLTKFKISYDCDQFFKLDTTLIRDATSPATTIDYQRYILEPVEKLTRHQEYNYLKVLSKIYRKGEDRDDRTDRGTRSIFGISMKFDISERIPLLTTKKIKYENIIKELLFFISGKTDTKILEQQGVNIWKDDTSEKSLKNRNLDYDEGDMGPGYGFQWRHWGENYDGDKSAEYQGIDQLTNLIDGLKKNPFSRRHVLSTWNVADIDKMALPPCHIFCQFYVSADGKRLDCQLYQRSGDMFIGVPYNIASYAIFTHMIAHLCNMTPRYLIHTLGDAHIYRDHFQAVDRQLKRTPLPLPTISFRRKTKIKTIDDFSIDNVVIDNYESWPFISGKS